MCLRMSHWSTETHSSLTCWWLFHPVVMAALNLGGPRCRILRVFIMRPIHYRWGARTMKFNTARWIKLARPKVDHYKLCLARSHLWDNACNASFHFRQSDHKQRDESIFWKASHFPGGLLRGNVPAEVHPESEMLIGLDLPSCKRVSFDKMDLGHQCFFSIIANISVTITVTINDRVFPLPFLFRYWTFFRYYYNYAFVFPYFLYRFRYR